MSAEVWNVGPSAARPAVSLGRAVADTPVEHSEVVAKNDENNTL